MKLSFSLSFVTSSGLQILVVTVHNEHRTQTASQFSDFLFLTAYQNAILNAIKTKNPALSYWVLFVTSKVEKSNFHRDLQGVMDYPIKRVEKQN